MNSELLAVVIEEQKQKERYDFTCEEKISLVEYIQLVRREGGLSYLRTLLIHVYSLISLTDRRTVESKGRPAHHGTSLRRVLSSEDADRKRALGEAIELSFQSLTDALAMIITDCEPAEPKKVSDDFGNLLMTDIRYRFRSQPLLLDPNLATRYVLAKTRTRFQRLPGLLCLIMVSNLQRASFNILQP